jgi:hypothetical protein
MEKEMKKEWRDFKSAREFARSLGLKGSTEWWTYCDSGNKPDNLPTNPNRTYKNKGWKGFKDFLGNEIERKNFKEAREFVQELNLTSVRKWEEYCKSGDKPEDIPTNPDIVYQQEWKGWSDFLNTNATRNYKNFKEAREFARSLNLKSSTEWRKYCVSGNKSLNVSSRPDSTYKKDWIDWGDFLGTGMISSQKKNKNYLSFNEAKKIARELAIKYNIKNWNDWQKAVKEGKIPDNIPGRPEVTYKKRRKTNEKV